MHGWHAVAPRRRSCGPSPPGAPAPTTPAVLSLIAEALSRNPRQPLALHLHVRSLGRAGRTGWRGDVRGVWGGVRGVGANLGSCIRDPSFPRPPDTQSAQPPQWSQTQTTSAARPGRPRARAAHRPALQPRSPTSEATSADQRGRGAASGGAGSRGPAAAGFPAPEPQPAGPATSLCGLAHRAVPRRPCRRHRGAVGEDGSPLSTPAAGAARGALPQAQRRSRRPLHSGGQCSF
jgi:hypothetical protein